MRARARVFSTSLPKETPDQCAYKLSFSAGLHIGPLHAIQSSVPCASHSSSSFTFSCTMRLFWGQFNNCMRWVAFICTHNKRIRWISLPASSLCLLCLLLFFMHTTIFRSEGYSGFSVILHGGKRLLAVRRYCQRSARVSAQEEGHCMQNYYLSPCISSRAKKNL